MSNIRGKFAKNLKNLRKRRGLTQEALAEKLDISVRYVQQWEGRNTPNVRIETLSKIASELKVSAADLIK